MQSDTKYTHTDEDRDVEYEFVISYELTIDSFIVQAADLSSIVDYSYDKKQGVDVTVDEESIVTRWFRDQIDRSTSLHDMVKAACEADAVREREANEDAVRYGGT